MTASASSPKFTGAQWLILLVAVIGFAFDTYELLMLPVVARPALSELLQLPPNHPVVRDWVGYLLWMAAICGGIFGLLGGWLTDRLGRKTVMVGSILVYSLSPLFAAFSTSLGAFVFFRCTTFVGVCVEFVAAITWLAELFPDKRQREIALGGTQAFASIGGLMVTGAYQYFVANGADLPGLPLPEPFNAHAPWRYTLTTGLIPGLMIALLLPWVPESSVWLEKRRSGALKRPSFGELFSPALRRTTLVTAVLSACAYGAAFGALQVTPAQVAPGLPDLAEQRRALKPLQDEAAGLIQQLDAVRPRFDAAAAKVPGLAEIAGQRSKLRVEINGVRRSVTNAATPVAAAEGLKKRLGVLTNAMAELEKKTATLVATAPEAKAALADREKILAQLGANRAKQEPHDTVIQKRSGSIQLWQELGGLGGRVALAVLVLTAISRGTLLRIFQIPGLFILPLTYWVLFYKDPVLFQWGIALCGFMVVAQFSYFGEYLPKVFPMHLRGTGGSFATNVGGRMFGTSAAFVTTKLVAPYMPGTTFEQVATAAAIVGTAVFVVGVIFSFLLPKAPAEAS